MFIAIICMMIAGLVLIEGPVPVMAQAQGGNVTLNPGYIAGSISIGDISQNTKTVWRARVNASGKDPTGNDLYAETWIGPELGNYALTVQIPDDVLSAGTSQEYKVSCALFYSSDKKEYLVFKEQTVTVSYNETTSLNFALEPPSYIKGDITVGCNTLSSGWFYAKLNSGGNYSNTQIRISSDGKFRVPIQPNSGIKVYGHVYMSNGWKYDLDEQYIDASAGNETAVNWTLLAEPCGGSSCNASISGDINLSGLGDNILHHHWIQVSGSTFKKLENISSDTYALDNLKGGDHTFYARSYLNSYVRSGRTYYDDHFYHPYGVSGINVNAPCDTATTHDVSTHAAFVNGKIILGPNTVVTLEEDTATDTYVYGYVEPNTRSYNKGLSRDEVDLSTGNYDLILSQGEWNVYYTKFHFRNDQSKLCDPENPRYVHAYLNIEDLTRTGDGKISLTAGQTISNHDIRYETGSVTIKFYVNGGGVLKDPYLTGENADRTQARISITAYGKKGETSEGEVTFIAIPGKYIITPKATVGESLVTFGKQEIEVEAGVCRGIDIHGPSLTMESPEAGYYTTDASITLSGKASDDMGIASVVVNGDTIPFTSTDNADDPNEVSFSTSIALTAGATTIQTVVTDTSEKVVSDNRQVYQDGSPPALNWQTPSEGMITTSSQILIRGTATDDSGIAEIKVNGENLSISSTDNPDDSNEVTFSMEVDLNDEQNQIEVLVKDTSNRTTEQTRTVIKTEAGAGPVGPVDDAAWTEMPDAETIPEDLSGVWISEAGNAFAVGEKGTILYYDGTNWSKVRVEGMSRSLTDVWGISESDVFAVGNDSTILHYDGSVWSRVMRGTSHLLTSVWGASRSDVFVVSLNGAILHYDGAGWEEMREGSPHIFLDIWGSSSDNLFAVGNVILHYDGLEWTEMESNASEDLLMSVWGSSGYDIFAAGKGGTILHYDGTAWQRMESGTSDTFKAVWGTSPIEVFAMTENGAIFFYNGAVWAEMASGTPHIIEDVAKNSGDDVFAVGPGGTILKLNTDDSGQCPGSICHVSVNGSDDAGNGSRINPFATIQRGVDMASYGYTVLVKPGTYNEMVNFNGKNITVASLFHTTYDADYISRTVIEGNGNGSLVTFEDDENSVAVLKGFTLTNGTYGVYCDNNASPSLVNLVITGNDGPGVYCNTSSPTLMSVTITGNSDGGVYCGDNSHPNVVNSVLWNNSPHEVYFREDQIPNSITISHSTVEGRQEGIVTNDNGTLNWLNGNIGFDPIFIDHENGDYRLSVNSSCIGAGTLDGVSETGKPRPEPGSSDPDMGAYESSRGEPEDDMTGVPIFENGLESLEDIENGELSGSVEGEVEFASAHDGNGVALKTETSRIKFDKVFGDLFPDAGKIEFWWVPAQDEDSSTGSRDAERAAFSIASDEISLDGWPLFSFNLQYRGVDDAENLTTIELKIYDDDIADYHRIYLLYDLNFSAGQDIHVEIKWDKKLGSSPIRAYFNEEVGTVVAEDSQNPELVIEKVQESIGSLTYDLELLRQSKRPDAIPEQFDAGMYIAGLSIQNRVRNLYVDAEFDGVVKGTANSPYKTIEEAITHAVPYTTIRVAKGTYTEALAIADIAGIRLEGGWNNNDGIWKRDELINSNLTIILARESSAVVQLDNAPETAVDGFAMQYGLDAKNSDDLEFRNNLAVGITPVRLENCNRAIISSSKIFGESENHDAGYGIVVANSTDVEMDDNIIRVDAGGVHFKSNCSGVIINNTIHIRNLENSAYGIQLESPLEFGDLRIVNNVFYFEGSDFIGIEEVGGNATPTALVKNHFYADETVILYHDENGQGDIDEGEKLNDGTLSDLPEQSGNFYHEMPPYVPCDEVEELDEEGNPIEEDPCTDEAGVEIPCPCVDISVIPKPSNADSDGDGLPDEWEMKYFGTLSYDGEDDVDGDDLTNIGEYLHGTHPRCLDTERDGMSDGWEVKYYLAPLMDDSLDDADGDGYYNVLEYSSEYSYSPRDRGSYPKFCPKGGIFKVGESGWVVLNWLYDGGMFEGELGIFALSGMKAYETNWKDFVENAARRAIQNAPESGYLVFSDRKEGSQWKGKLNGEEDCNHGPYKGMKRFKMTPGDQFAVILAPNCTLADIIEDPSIMHAGLGTRPFFSFASPNSDPGSHMIQIADMNPSSDNPEDDGLNDDTSGEGSENDESGADASESDASSEGDAKTSGITFVFEDTDPQYSDMDYNDLVFQLAGTENETSPILTSLLLNLDEIECEDGCGCKCEEVAQDSGDTGNSGDPDDSGETSDTGTTTDAGDSGDTGDSGDVEGSDDTETPMECRYEETAEEDASSVPPVPDEVREAIKSEELGQQLYNYLEAQNIDGTAPWITLILDASADLMVYDPQERECGKEGCYIPGAVFEFGNEGEHQVISLLALEEGDYRVVIRRWPECGTCLLIVEEHQGEVVLTEERERDIEEYLILTSEIAVSGELAVTHIGDLNPPTTLDAEILIHDITGDGRVDILDVRKTRSKLDTCEGDQDYDPFYDFFGDDGCIRFPDLTSVLGEWYNPEEDSEYVPDEPIDP